MAIKMKAITKKNKRAYFFSTDALIAVIIILSVILIIRPIAKQKQVEMSLQEDMLRILSSMKISEIDNAYAKQLMSEGVVAEPNASVIEQIGEFYAREMPEAELLVSSVLSQLSPRENIGIWLNNQLIASHNSSSIENARNVWTARQIISGIEKGMDVRGYSSRAFLSRTSKVSYFYFGGYIGDGNITAEIEYNGSIEDSEIEAAFNRDFGLYINGNLAQHYSVENPLSPKKILLLGYLDRFISGKNYVEFRSSESDFYIAGGYIKVVYSSSDVFSATKKHSFPGVNGVVNIYDSFYIPGVLENMSVYLHYKSPYVMFLSIGNTTVFNVSSSSETSATLNNQQLSALLDYEELSKETIPLRLGLYELESIRQGNADVVLITDLSGSMEYRLDSDSDGVSRACDDSSLYDSGTKRISLAKCLDKMVVDSILNVSGNRLALSAFYGDEKSPFKGRVYQEDLTENASYLKSRIDAYASSGGTCICCAENDAFKILDEQSFNDSGRRRFVIVMSDGIPTHTCQAASGCAGTRTGLQSDEGLWLGYGAGCYGGADDCNVNDCLCASQNANWSSCRLQQLNATVYSIGFGPVSSCRMANNTLQAISQCGNGRYYSSANATLLSEFYQSISEEIIQLSFTEQLSRVAGIFNNTILYPDSHISFDYDAEAAPYGLSIPVQGESFGNEITEGSFYIPQDAEIAEASVVSYSGAKWTDNVYIKNSSDEAWRNVFSLASYSSDYLGLGDAYLVNIPLSFLAKGNNSVKITTGTSPENSSGGSSADKAIYTLVKQISGYSKISSVANGCKWHIEFDDSTNITASIPANYTGADECYYTSQSIAYNPNDAIDNAVYSLLASLDLNSNHKIESKFSEQDLQLSSSEIQGIPFTWSSEVQVRVWR